MSGPCPRCGGVDDTPLLREIAEQLEAWARQTKAGGWSGQHVDAQRALADRLWIEIGRRAGDPAPAPGGPTSPPYAWLLQSPDFRDWLAERVPGLEVTLTEEAGLWTATSTKGTRRVTGKSREAVLEAMKALLTYDAGGRVASVGGAP